MPLSLELLAVEDLPEDAVPAFEAALREACATIGLFHDEAADTWRVEGVRETGAHQAALEAGLALAAAVTGVAPTLQRGPIEAEGWLARTIAGFPEQRIGQRFLVRPTHLPNRPTPGRIVLQLDAGLAFGSGEHASTRLCLLALEAIAPRVPPGGVLDLGTGSGILAIAAAKRLRRRVLATDIDPWSVRVAAQNAVLNGVQTRVRARVADGWRGLPRGQALVFANILARPLCAMARDLAGHLAPGGLAILSGLLSRQARMVLAAHRRCGLVLRQRFDHAGWCALVVARGRET